MTEWNFCFTINYMCILTYNVVIVYAVARQFFVLFLDKKDSVCWSHWALLNMRFTQFLLYAPAVHCTCWSKTVLWPWTCMYLYVLACNHTKEDLDVWTDWLHFFVIFILTASQRRRLISGQKTSHQIECGKYWRKSCTRENILLPAYPEKPPDNHLQTKRNGKLVISEQTFTAPHGDWTPERLQWWPAWSDRAVWPARYWASVSDRRRASMFVLVMMISKQDRRTSNKMFINGPYSEQIDTWINTRNIQCTAWNCNVGASDPAK